MSHISILSRIAAKTQFTSYNDFSRFPVMYTAPSPPKASVYQGSLAFSTNYYAMGKSTQYHARLSVSPGWDDLPSPTHTSHRYLRRAPVVAAQCKLKHPVPRMSWIENQSLMQSLEDQANELVDRQAQFWLSQEEHQTFNRSDDDEIVVLPKRRSLVAPFPIAVTPPRQSPSPMSIDVESIPLYN